jgi:hypothetical protein
MLDREIEERRGGYVYHRDGLRRVSKWLLYSVICMIVLVFLSSYSLKTYPQNQLYVTTTEGMLYGTNVYAEKDFTGVLNVGVYLAKDRAGQPTYGVIDGG